MITESDWEKRYQMGRSHWDRGHISPAVAAWYESGELTPGRILLPGCGRGHEADWLIERGFAVTGIDFAQTPMRELRERLAERGLAAELLQMDLFDFAPEQPFDAVYEQTCLCALAPERWAAYVNCLQNWIKPGGLLFALFMQTGREGGPPYHCDLDEMCDLFAPPAWTWLDENAMEVAHPQKVHELGYRLQRNA